MARDYPQKKVVKRKPAAVTKVPVKQSKGIFVYLFVGFIVILFITFLVYLEKQPESNAKKLAHPANKQATSEKIQKNQPSKNQSTDHLSIKSTSKKNKPIAQTVQVPEYEFYTMLPDVKVEVIVPEIAKQPLVKATSPKTTTATTTATTTTTTQTKQTKNIAPVSTNKTLYQLQIGAYSSVDKAESMKAQLAFMGVQSSISSSLLNMGSIHKSSINTGSVNKSKKIYKVRIGPTSDENTLKVIKDKLEKMHINTLLQKI